MLRVISEPCWNILDFVVIIACQALLFSGYWWVGIILLFVTNILSNHLEDKFWKLERKGE